MDDLALLQNQHWVLIDDIENEKQVYLFRPGNELLISKNGKIRRNKWEYLGNKSLIIDLGEEAFLFKHGFFDENLLALKIDSKEEYAFFINENKFDGDLNSFSKVIQFMKAQYLSKEGKFELKDIADFEIAVEEPKLTEEELKALELRKKLDEREMVIVTIVLVIAVLIVGMLAFWASMRDS
jgi:hypothetical protein